MRKKTIVSKAIIHISGLSHGGLRLKSPFRTDFNKANQIKHLKESIFVHSLKMVPVSLILGKILQVYIN
jgi:hypothetical protein